MNAWRRQGLSRHIKEKLPLPLYIHIFFFFFWCCDPTRVIASSFLRFLDHTQRRTTVGRTPLDEWSDLYLTTHNTHNRQTSMPLVEFEPTMSAGERPQTYALDRAATGTGFALTYKFIVVCRSPKLGNQCSQDLWKSWEGPATLSLPTPCLWHTQVQNCKMYCSDWIHHKNEIWLVTALPTGIPIAALTTFVSTSKARFAVGRGNSFLLSFTAAMLRSYS
jgi:hypothetical protein